MQVVPQDGWIGPEAVEVIPDGQEIARREFGRLVPQMDRNALSKLIDFLMQHEPTS